VIRQQRGSTMILVIFVIVIASLLASFAARSVVTQRDSVTMDLVATRTLAAARAGLQWSAYRARQQNNCSAGAMTFPPGPLAGTRVRTDCVMREHTTSSGIVRVFRISAFAQYGVYGAADYASQRVEALTR